MVDIETIEMPVADAKAKIKQYEKGLGKKSNPEWEAALIGYKQLAKGTPLINLHEVINAAPIDDKGRPMLAIARADRERVKFRKLWHTERFVFNTGFSNAWGRLPPPRSTLRVDVAWDDEPDPDPILLKHIHGPLYAIVGSWDLTDLERAIMRGRLVE